MSAPAQTLLAETAGATHRERLIAALASCIEERGYRPTTVADVVRRARTSRRTFYEHFAGLEACFLALFDATNDAMMAQIAAAVHPVQPLEDQVALALDAYIETISARPALYRSFVRELPGLGQAGSERQRAVIERFADLLVGLVESGRRERPELEVRPLSRDTAVMIVGGLRELAVIALGEGRPLSDLRAGATETLLAILAGTVLRDTDPGSLRSQPLWNTR